MELLDALAQLRAQYDKPPSPMEVLRQSLNAQLHPPVQVLNEEQRKIFSNDLRKLEDFLRSRDGQDAIKLLVSTFEAFEAATDEAD